MTRRSTHRTAGRATDREVVVVAAVLVAGSEKAAAHRLGLSHSTVKHHLANARFSARNLGYSAEAYIDAFPGNAVMEIHLAGHTPDPLLGQTLLIDSHDAPIAPEVWALYARLIARIGPRPTLIERDDHVPPFSELLAERTHADALLRDLETSCV